jgi:hypothetical protein
MQVIDHYMGLHTLKTLLLGLVVNFSSNFPPEGTFSAEFLKKLGFKNSVSRKKVTKNRLQLVSSYWSLIDGAGAKSPDP